MPKGYENVLIKLLKVDILDKGQILKKEYNNKGIPQGGIISPLLMN